jgi:hypothetical protein
MTSRAATLIVGLVLVTTVLSTTGAAFAADLGCAPLVPPTALGQPGGDPSALVRAAAVARPPFHGDRFFRTELYFGSAKPDGTAVTEAEFKEFLDQCVTPRFPDGLTLLTGLGQFRGSNGVIVQERSMLLILLYPVQARRESSILVEEIRDAYKRIFLQESVLRSDRCCEQVGF